MISDWFNKISKKVLCAYADTSYVDTNERRSAVLSVNWGPHSTARTSQSVLAILRVFLYSVYFFQCRKKWGYPAETVTKIRLYLPFFERFRSYINMNGKSFSVSFFCKYEKTGQSNITDCGEYFNDSMIILLVIKLINNNIMNNINSIIILLYIKLYILY